VLEVNRGRLRTRVHPECTGIARLTLFDWVWKRLPEETKPISDNIIGGFAIAFRFCRRPTAVQFLLSLLRRLSAGGKQQTPSISQQNTGSNRRVIFNNLELQILSSFLVPCATTTLQVTRELILRQDSSSHAPSNHIAACLHRTCSSA
jgi:hypothetical protein